MRKPFQGVLNIIRFNWHFYVLSIAMILLVIIFNSYIPAAIHLAIYIFLLLFVSSILISLMVSTYIYDVSNLYKLSWLNNYSNKSRQKIVNIHAGFDETSNLLKNIFPDSELIVFDFYDPVKHTEVSIKRARNAYPNYPNTQLTNTTSLALNDNSAEKIFAFLSAHEIRNDEERIAFFKELRRVLTQSGQIFVTEHLRDAANFFAYNIGAFHFHSRASWLKTFHLSGLQVSEEIKITPFITTFILGKNGNAS